MSTFMDLFYTICAFRSVTAAGEMLDQPVDLDGTDFTRLRWTRVYLIRRHPKTLSGFNFLSRLHEKDSPLLRERIVFSHARQHWFYRGEEVHKVPWSFTGTADDAYAVFRSYNAMEEFGDDLLTAENRWIADGDDKLCTDASHQSARLEQFELWFDENIAGSCKRLTTGRSTGRKRIKGQRSCKGAILSEMAATLVLVIPLTVLLAYVLMEISQAYFLKSALAQCARQAARDLAVGYGANPQIAFDRGTQDEVVFDHIRIHNVVNDSAQFEDPVFETGAQPHNVKVIVRYTGGEYGLSTFPHPDPLNLGPLFPMSAESTYRLE